MGTGRKMGMSLQKGVKKFVNEYRVREIRQWVLREIVNRIYVKMTVFTIIYGNLW